MTSPNGRIPLILVPGLGADHRLFEPQSEVLDNAIAVDWIEPRSGETLARYALRMARAVDPGGPCYLAGCSMGGMVALEMSRHLDARGCFLISSVGHPREIPRRWRWLRPLAGAVPKRVGEFLAGVPILAARGLLALCGRALDPTRRAVLRQLADQDRRFLWWAAGAVLYWRAPQEPWSVPVAQVHGDCDRVLPCARTHPDQIIPGGDHLMVRDRAAEVIRFLDAQMTHLELVGQLRPRPRTSATNTCENPIAGALLKS